MAVTRLRLTDFRSYREAAIEAGPGWWCSPARMARARPTCWRRSRCSPRAAACAARASPRWRGATGRAASRSRRGWTAISRSAPARFRRAPERRQVRINGAPASANALSEWLAVLWLTPAMDRLFTDSAGNRRRFLDRLVLALRSDHAGHSARYEAAMRARNKLLAEGAPDATWLTALEARMAEHGAAIAAARRETVAALAERLAAAPEGAFPRASLALDGEEPEDLAAALAAGRARDATAGRTLVGPHRIDLAVTHQGKAMPAASCSTGEQKALLIALILAHSDLVAARAGRRPILLLDEIAAHLDPARRAALFDRLAADGGQVWMTGTEPSLFAGIGPEATRLAVADGAIHLA